MDFKDLLLYVTGAPGPEVPAAVALAAQHNADLTALHVVEMSPTSIPMEMGFVTDYIAEERKICLRVAEDTRVFVEDAANQAGVRVEWRRVEGETVSQLSIHAHVCDLVVVGLSAGRDERPFHPALLVQTVLHCGKPVLAIPKDYDEQGVADSVVVAWNGTRECARALTDALPILRRADRVSVVVVDPSSLRHDLGDVPGSDICRHLSRHGVHAQAQVIDSGQHSVGAAIVEHARSQDAQIIVMGGFGHWRVGELVFGGATRDILREARLPVLLSH